MKKLFKVCIFAVGFGIISNNTNAYDGMISKSDDLLVKNNAVVFADYMSKNAKEFIVSNENEWQIFNKVVTSYNQSTSKFLTTSATEKEAFFAAADKLKENLGTAETPEMKQWKNSVENTTNVFRFIWESSQNTPELEMPTIPVPQWWGVLSK